jgi:hypothetical protein
MDDTLAAIASILDHAPIDGEPDRTVAEDRLQPGLAEADGYHKVGPGPFDAIRFKWTVRRRDSGDYDVEERIGAASRPLLTGPMSAAAAIRLVDEREYQARQNYEKLRGEMSGNGSAANRTHGEA